MGSDMHPKTIVAQMRTRALEVVTLLDNVPDDYPELPHWLGSVEHELHGLRDLCRAFPGDKDGE